MLFKSANDSHSFNLHWKHNQIIQTAAPDLINSTTRQWHSTTEIWKLQVYVACFYLNIKLLPFEAFSSAASICGWVKSTEALNGAEPSMLKLCLSYHLLCQKWGLLQMIKYGIQNIFILKYHYLKIPFNIIVCHYKRIKLWSNWYLTMLWFAEQTCYSHWRFIKSIQNSHWRFISFTREVH